MCLFGTTMSDRIRTTTGGHLLKHEMNSEFFEQSVTKMLDQYRYRNRERVRTEQKHSELLETRGIEAVEKGMVKIRT